MERPRKPGDRPVRWSRVLPLTLLLPISLAIGPLVGRDSAWVESYYSRGMYPYVSSVLRVLHRPFPFSLVELSLFGLAAFAFLRGFLSLAGIVRGTRSVANVGLHAVAISGALLGICGAAWFGLWGLNYQRQTFAGSSGWEVAPSDSAELEALCVALLAEAGDLRRDLSETEDGVFRMPGGLPSALERAEQGFAAVAGEYPVLEWNYGRPKPAWLSPVLSSVGISGIFSPFTGEPHVNRDLADSELPFTVAHELAHQIGFAREDEANFLAILSCRAHPDPDFRYSGALQAAAYAMGALGRADLERASELWKNAHPGILRDLADSEAKWKSAKSPSLTKISWEMNHAYLKSQGVQQGTASYGAVVDLLLAERRANAPAVPEVNPSTDADRAASAD